MAASKAKSTSANIKQIEKRWTKTLIDVGFTAIPNIVLDKQKALGLKALDINLILQIAKHWWTAENAPFPAIKTLADTLGVTTRTVQKHISSLEEKGLIERHEQYYAQGGQRSNAYTFDGLIKKCKPFAIEAKAEREKKKTAKKARIRRKTPLHIVKK